MRILVTGREGQIARSLRERGPSLGHEIITLSRSELDLSCDPGKIAHIIVAQQPDAVISAAAYTAVDKAESDSVAANAVNVRGAAAVAEATRQLEVPLLHLSTDYVFDGTKPAPYTEDDPTCPQSVYGVTKRDGEEAVLASHENVAILRTAWVYSPFGNNFVKTMLRLAAERVEIGVVSDQRGNPSSALDLADGLVAIAENLMESSDPQLRGIFHMAGTDTASWAEFAEAIFEASDAVGGPHAAVRPIGTDEYPTPASRPANSSLDCTKLLRLHGVRLPQWKSSLTNIVERLVDPASQA
jgi:dTDP-4-dehydrorhamnose reductase